jgi:hypothetical protein
MQHFFQLRTLCLVYKVAINPLLLFLCSVLAGNHSLAQQKEVPQQVMQQIYDQVKTPYKYGLVLVPGDASKKNRLSIRFSQRG